MRALVIAGAASGVGKTTIASGVMGALRRRGLAVAPFKAGPDYIDPTYHAAACGAPSRNLDTWLLPAENLVALFLRAASRADVAVVEGVMGLFDGRSGEDEAGSTAHLAKLLGLPVAVALDVSGMARSAAAQALGYQRLDPALKVAGFILNGVAGPAHLEMCAGPIQTATGLPVLGHLPRREDLRLPERHLGLVPTVEGPAGADFFDRLAEQVRQTVDLDGLLALAGEPRPAVAPNAGLFPAGPQPQRAAIAVAQDRAFSFYYQDSLDLLEAWGAELLPFSPLEDSRLPDGCSGVYIGGGFPELYAAELAANRGMLASLREAAARGTPIYGECGGLMYLGEGITDFEGRRHHLAGLVPAWSSMAERRLHLGYRTVRARDGHHLLEPGQETRGHEFHWSVLEREPAPDGAAYDVLEEGATTPRQAQVGPSAGSSFDRLRTNGLPSARGQPPQSARGQPRASPERSRREPRALAMRQAQGQREARVEGFVRGSVVASYVHLHLGRDPALARRFIQACEGWRTRY
ncbi:MAG: cobyrinate a,c-diamide synthase [Chloroflexi bacterium]|nr:cobyrinate a,c-diamide synthase [Chloroflexota bacterium]